MLDEKSSERLEKLVCAWTALQQMAPVSPIHNEAQHSKMLQLLDWLRDEVRGRRSHPLAGLLEIVVELIEDYETDRFPIPDARPRDVLRFLMDQHSLRQADLRKELGSQGVVSEILRGKRDLNVRQAKALAKRFGVLPSVFI